MSESPPKGSMWNNNKNGNTYEVLFMATDQTNASAGQPIVVYKQRLLARIYTRVLSEFLEKFSPSPFQELPLNMESVIDALKTSDAEQD